MVEVLRAHRDERASEIVEHMVRRIDEFAGVAPQFDDITLMALKRVG
jgi:serine phosphatase RsbU (regulator of sigma subunit)